MLRASIVEDFADLDANLQLVESYFLMIHAGSSFFAAGSTPLLPPPRSLVITPTAVLHVAAKVDSSCPAKFLLHPIFGPGNVHTLRW